MANEIKGPGTDCLQGGDFTNTNDEEEKIEIGAYLCCEGYETFGGGEGKNIKVSYNSHYITIWKIRIIIALLNCCKVFQKNLQNLGKTLLTRGVVLSKNRPTLFESCLWVLKNHRKSCGYKRPTMAI